jgi:hypothetical protein
MLGAIIGGAASLAGSALTAHLSKRESARNRRYQERMSNTAHRREVEDLRAAGINPILSAKLGGASTPVGAVAPMPDFGASITSGMQAATQHSQMLADTNLKNANAALTKTKDVLASNLIPGSEAIGTVTKQIENLVKAASDLVGQSRADYRGMLQSVGEMFTQALSKINTLGGQAQNTIQNIWFEAGAKEREALEWLRNEFGELK